MVGCSMVINLLQHSLAPRSEYPNTILINITSYNNHHEKPIQRLFITTSFKNNGYFM